MARILKPGCATGSGEVYRRDQAIILHYSADYLQQNLTFDAQIMMADGQNLQNNVRLSSNRT